MEPDDLTVFRYQTVEPAVRRLPIQVTVFWVNSSVALVNPLPEIVEATTDISNPVLDSVQVNTPTLNDRRIGNLEGAVDFVPVWIEEDFVEEASLQFQLMKKFSERPVELSDVIRERLAEVLISWVLQGLADRLVVLEPEYIRNVPRLKRGVVPGRTQTDPPQASRKLCSRLVVTKAASPGGSCDCDRPFPLREATNGSSHLLKAFKDFLDDFLEQDDAANPVQCSNSPLSEYLEEAEPSGWINSQPSGVACQLV